MLFKWHLQNPEDRSWKSSDTQRPSHCVKIALSLYKVQQNIYLLDFQRVEVRFCSTFVNSSFLYDHSDFLHFLNNLLTHFMIYILNSLILSFMHYIDALLENLFSIIFFVHSLHRCWNDLNFFFDRLFFQSKKFTFFIWWPYFSFWNL